MSKNAYEVKLRSIMRSLEEPLRSLKNNTFDPENVIELFERFAVIRKGLKEQFNAIFSDLPDRPLPIPVVGEENEGRGYIKRRYVEQLFDDCRDSVDILETISEEAPASVLQAKPKAAAASVGNEIFISHASKDRPIVKEFVEKILRLGLEVRTDSIFCSSLEGMDIKNGSDFRNQIQAALHSAKLIILIVTPNYKASEVCQNEMGAAWASGKRVIPLIVEPINYKSVGVLMEPLQVPKLADTTALSKLKDDITQELGITVTKTDMWETAKAGFLKELPSKIAEVKFTKILSAKEVEQIMNESDKLKEQAGLAAKKLTELQAKYDALSEVKGTSATEMIDEKFDDRGPMEKFKALTQEVEKALSSFSRVVQAIVICEHFKATYDPPFDAFRSELDSATRKKQISYDDGAFTVNDEKPEVKSVRIALNKLQKFLEHEATDKFPAQYEKDYESPLEIDNQEFWEEHFGLKVPE